MENCMLRALGSVCSVCYDTDGISWPRGYPDNDQTWSAAVKALLQRHIQWFQPALMFLGTKAAY